MTDPFEEAVRQAARGLSDGAGADMPTYHGAWEQGRRRRFRKQAGLTFAGGVLVLGALAAGLGNLPGRSSVEVDDVALEAAAVTAVPAIDAISTTLPLPAPPLPSATLPSETLPSASSPSQADTADAAPAPTATMAPTTTTPQTDAPAAVEPSEPAEPSAPPATAPAPAPTATTVTPPTATAVPPTPEPTLVPLPTAEPVAQDTAQTPTTDPAPSDAADPGVAASTDSPTDAAGADTAPQDFAREPAETGLTTALPNVTFVGPDQKPDATILGENLVGDDIACDRDGDNQADATCRLFPRYACTGDGDVRTAYLPVDLDEDGAFDTCVASGLTACDTTGDGLADTPCTIELANSEQEG